MPRLGGRTNSSYPLARASRARRRLLIRQAISDAAASNDKSSGAKSSHARRVKPDERGDDTVRLPTAAEQSAQPPAILIDGVRRSQHLLKGQQPVTWVFTGDGIAQNVEQADGWRSFSEHFSERVRWELRRLNDVVISTDTIGDRSGSLLKELDARALRFNPDVVSVTIGMNDAMSGPKGRAVFRDHLTDLVDTLQAKGAIVLLNTPNAIPQRESVRFTDLAAYVDIIRKVASDRSAPLVDHWTHWKQAKPKDDELVKWLSEDRIHPGIFGHREMAKLLFNTLGIFDPSSPTCLAKVP